MYTLRNICKNFKVDGETFEALSDINLDLPDVGFVGITGESGSGKSTLLNLIASYDRPTEGDIFYNSFNIGAAKENDLYKYRQKVISVLFQDSILIEDMTIEENIGLPLRIARYERSTITETVKDITKKLGIDHLNEKYPTMLSGGEKQRVVLARSLITNPDVLLCDECTSGLDEKNASFVMKVLKDISKDKLVLLISHNQKLVDDYCEHQVKLDSGRIVKNTIGTDTDLKKKSKSNYKKTKKKRTNWTFDLAWRYFKENIKRNSFAMISCFICFFMCFVGIGFILGSPKAIEKQESRSLINSYCLVSKKEVQNIDSSKLSLVKCKAPENDDVKTAINNTLDVEIVDNLSFILPESGSAILQSNKEVEAKFYPLLTTELTGNKKELLIRGKEFKDNDFDNCYVNEEFVKNSGTDCLGKTINLKHRIVFKDGEEIIDEVLEYKFKIAGVVSELSFLNGPHVYYSYKGLLNYSRLKIVDGIAVYKRIKNAPDDSPLRSFSSICFAKNDNGINLIKELNNNDIDDYEFNSVFFTTMDAFSKLIKSIDSCILPFLLINILIITLFVSFVTYSSIIEKQKDLLIVRSFGASNKDVSTIFIYETLICVGISYILNILLYKLFESRINRLIFSKTGLNNLINFPYVNGSVFPFAYIICGTLIISLIVIMVCYAFSLIKNRDSLSTELKK